MVDEAQALKPAVRETIRSLWDRGTDARLGPGAGPAFGCMLAGNDLFMGKGGDIRVAGFRPLLTRVTLNIALPRPLQAEQAVVASFLFPDAPELLAIVAGFGVDAGNLRAQDVAPPVRRRQPRDARPPSPGDQDDGRIMMPTMRKLLSQDPMTFNELLDLFEVHVASIGGPITRGHDLLREEIGMGENVALGHIFGVACDAEDRTKRLGQIRATRNAGTNVTITLTAVEHRQLDTGISDVIDLLNDTASTLDFLSGGFDSGRIDPDQPAIAAPLRLLGRALRRADQIESPALMMADRKIRAAVAAVRKATRQAALQRREAA